MGRQPCNHPNPQAGRREDEPPRSPGRPAVTEIGFRARKLQAGPHERGRGRDGPCGGPAPPARRSGRLRRGGRAAEAPAQARGACSPLPVAARGPPPRSGSPCSRPEQGAGEWGPRRRVAPRRDRAHPDCHRCRRCRRRLCFQDGRSKGRGHPRFRFRGAVSLGGVATALGGRADVACVSLPPPAPGSGNSRRMGSGLQLRGAGLEPFCTSGRPARALRLILRPQSCPAGGPGESQRPQRTGAPHPARSPPHDPRPYAGRQVLLEGDPRGAGVSPA